MLLQTPSKQSNCACVKARLLLSGQNRVTMIWIFIGNLWVGVIGSLCRCREVMCTLGTDVFCNECSAILCTMTIVSVVNAWIIAVHWLCHYVACRVVSHSRRRLANFDKLTSVASYEVMVIFCVEQYTYRGPKTPLQTCAILADWLNRSMQDCDEGAMIFRLYICFAGCRSNHIISEQLHRTSNWSFSSARMRLYCARLVVVLSVRWTNHYLAAHPARWSVCCGRPLYLARKV